MCKIELQNIIGSSCCTVVIEGREIRTMCNKAKHVWVDCGKPDDSRWTKPAVRHNMIECERCWRKRMHYEKENQAARAREEIEVAALEQQDRARGSIFQLSVAFSTELSAWLCRLCWVPGISYVSGDALRKPPELLWNLWRGAWQTPGNGRHAHCSWVHHPYSIYSTASSAGAGSQYSIDSPCFVSILRVVM